MRTAHSSTRSGRLLSARGSLLLGLLFQGTLALAGDWPGFHGLERQGNGGASLLPITWFTNQHLAWKTMLPGRGHSSPVVSGTNIYLTTAYPSGRQASARRVPRLCWWTTCSF